MSTFSSIRKANSGSRDLISSRRRFMFWILPGPLASEGLGGGCSLSKQIWGGRPPIWSYIRPLTPYLRAISNCEANCSYHPAASGQATPKRSEEHTSELQSLRHLVC